MPDIKVKPNQLIEYPIPFDGNSRFYCDEINSGIVIVSRNDKLGRLIVAHCEPGLTDINALLVQCGMVLESGDPDSTWYLVCGPKCNEELLRKITSILENGKVKFRIFNIKTHFFIEVGGDGTFLVQDQPQDGDKHDFADRQ
ncbi:MAG: hypothetical protein KKC79_10100 [Gammaproteobacteria bacterium]|nr:hypothetical protein [Gammaproteobacteria bacterium]MBU1440965.1 hypothetical protein [Gammaproteobacteria bacterium]MBU2287722.1 hypothetical protein [Gammaproteobacteria bacterium]MBU2408985.1 hypothetical protein [Gammaproteobacteria bacterium]